MTISALAAGICVSSGGIHALSVGMALPTLRRGRSNACPVPKDAPAVTIVQPLCGVEKFSRETLRSIFALDYPDYEIVFCLASADDPIAPLVRGAIAANPERPARLLIGDDRISANPKLNNVVKGWKAARHDWVIIANFNVLMPADYIQRLLGRWRPNTGIVCAPPIGSRPKSFAAEIECAFLNTYEARWQYAAEAAGFGFAQGKTMLWRRDILETGGGIEALGAEIAEDAASTKLIHAQGFDAHLVCQPFQQPLGARRMKDVWSRPASLGAASARDLSAAFCPRDPDDQTVDDQRGGFRRAGVRDQRLDERRARGAVLVCARSRARFVAGWPMGWRSPPAWIIRDLLLPALWSVGVGRRQLRLARQRHERRRSRPPRGAVGSAA